MLSTAVLAVVAVVLLLRFVVQKVRERFPKATGSGPITLGFFHPYAHSGGGGERVLWQGIDALLGADSDTELNIVIYTGDKGVSAEDFFERVASRFGITFDNVSDVRFVYLDQRRLLEADRYPRFTMLGQSIGSMILAWEALNKLRPDVFVDTTGFAFTYPVAKFARCLVACYTHYPTITTDMMSKLHEKRPTYNNDESISGSPLKTYAKVLYYRLFAACYRWAGNYADVVMVNSTWTQGHISSLWAGKKPMIVYPPCNTETLQEAPLGERERVVLSVGQFRPEKDHRRQIDAFSELKKLGGGKYDDVRLVLLGGCRGDADEKLVEQLKQQVEVAGLKESVEFKINAPFHELQSLLGSSLVGIHTMWNEHFGIGVVEMMAAGCIPVAHDSGGPKADIVVPHKGRQTGFLATTPTEYAQAIARILDGASEGEGDEKDSDNDNVDPFAMAAAGRESANRFSDDEFSTRFYAALVRVILSANRNRKMNS